MRFALGVTLLCACVPPTNEKIGQVDGGLAWTRINQHFTLARPIVVVSAQGRAKVVAVDSLGDGTSRLVTALWDGSKELEETRELARFTTRYIPNMDENGGLMFDVSPVVGDDSQVFLVDDEGTFAVEALNTTYSFRPGSLPHVYVGSSTGDQVWMVRDTPYGLPGGMTMPCLGSTQELFGVFADGGATGRVCPFPDDLIDAGSPRNPILEPGRPLVHPLQRVFSRPGIFAFATFDAAGKVETLVPEAPHDGWGEHFFWPSRTGAPTQIVEHWSTLAVTEKRLVGEQVLTTPSILDGQFRGVVAVWRTSLGVVLQSHVPDADCKSPTGEVDFIYCHGNLRLLWVEEDLSAIKGFIDYDDQKVPNGCFGRVYSVAEHDGKLYGFWGGYESVTDPNQYTVALCVAPLEFKPLQ